MCNIFSLLNTFSQVSNIIMVIKQFKHITTKLTPSNKHSAIFRSCKIHNIRWWRWCRKKRFILKQKVITSLFIPMLPINKLSFNISQSYKLSPNCSQRVPPCWDRCWSESQSAGASVLLKFEHFISTNCGLMWTKRKKNFCFKHGGTVCCMARDLQCMVVPLCKNSLGKTLSCTK